MKEIRHILRDTETRTCLAKASPRSIIFEKLFFLDLDKSSGLQNLEVMDDIGIIFEHFLRSTKKSKKKLELQLSIFTVIEYVGRFFG